ncbi:hypothetical protein HanHA300_Chr10g0372651 [Helianthus annuus]|nr:hypothetical protein HanHA300_Chr10g0372651 [Helianthus annuus]KAJ0530865.1 hypothetical protein HanHA89_Chr10g0394821 [Helianthus annuus]
MVAVKTSYKRHYFDLCSVYRGGSGSGSEHLIHGRLARESFSFQSRIVDFRQHWDQLGQPTSAQDLLLGFLDCITLISQSLCSPMTIFGCGMKIRMRSFGLIYQRHVSCSDINLTRICL